MATTRSNPATTLETLREANEILDDPSQDIRGRDVIAKDGEKVGKVDALYVDITENKVRLMRVEAGGFLGIGERKWLVPVDAITSVDKDHVHIDQTHHHFIEAPVYDPLVVSIWSYGDYDGLYGYYGYGRFWNAGYLYPRWW